MHLLLVDDDPVIRTLLSAILTRAGWLVVAAASGEEAVERLAEAEFDAILSDVQMPGMDGRELLARIRANGSTAHMPVILMTATADVSLLDTLRAEGAIGSIAKPIDPRTIVERLQQMLTPNSQS